MNTFPSIILISSLLNWKIHANEALGESACGVWCANVCMCVCACVPVHKCVYGCVHPHRVRWRKTKTINPILIFMEHLWSLSLKIIVELLVYSLFNPLIDDSGRKMTAAHPWQGGKFYLFVYDSCTIYLVESEWWEVTCASWFKMLL